ncbi:NAD(P)H-hydrate dehydratase [Magnetovibrio sp. PR-2]|uniref:NAD(P)H-hydrate dehydratase n=1 Tax=Magnetovibrio sp. PR-2 TaxID=3120356 RepID=UPI002FCE6314
MEILSVTQMQAADRTAIASGVLGEALMENAGRAVVDAIVFRWEKRPVAVLAGPGNNGGDGYVIARLLKKLGWTVTVYSPCARSDYFGDAAKNVKRWRNKIQPLEAALDVIASQDGPDELLVVDALFGTGLTRPLDGAAKILAELITVGQAQGTAPILVAVDIPSGLNGDTGRALGGRRRGGICFHADLTVTFCRPKPAHALMPGRGVCGDIVIADIGVEDSVVADVHGETYLNTPALWADSFPVYEEDIHKYARGHVVVLGGETMTGAARLASLAVRRAGAGLCTVAVPKAAFPIYAAALDPGTLVAPIKGVKDFKKIIADSRKNACVIGPGAGLSTETRDIVLAAVKAGKACVLDADALSVFENDRKALFKLAKAQRKADQNNESVVLTPHGGEFQRLFPNLAKRLARPKVSSEDSKLSIVRESAKRSGCVVLLKGPDTVIAAPDGRASISVNAPATLATAGAGDVLAGMIGALMGQDMPAFEAANAAVWLHGEAANAFGPGLIAEDISDELPRQLDVLLEELAETVV